VTKFMSVSIRGEIENREVPLSPSERSASLASASTRDCS
jgi:hypothetical protein